MDDDASRLSAGADLPLLLWLSPAFPVGAFAYSHGLEWAVEAGDIVDASLASTAGSTISGPSARRARTQSCSRPRFRAAAAADWPALVEMNELAVALAASAERRLETTAQGARLCRRRARSLGLRGAQRRLSPRGAASPIPSRSPRPRRARAAARRQPARFRPRPFAANLVSAALRLGAIGQTDGQRSRGAPAARPGLGARGGGLAASTDLGACAFRSDLAAMRHETQYSRLFRS